MNLTIDLFYCTVGGFYFILFISFYFYYKDTQFCTLIKKCPKNFWFCVFLFYSQVLKQSLALSPF